MKVLEVFWRFFALGWVSFGGPMAHIGYFRHTFVEKVAWLDDDHYSRLVALSQFLPGSGSSPGWVCYWAAPCRFLGRLCRLHWFYLTVLFAVVFCRRLPTGY